MSAVVISALAPTELAAATEELALVLHGCVLDGASVGFVLPFNLDDASAFWRGQQAALTQGDKHILVARDHTPSGGGRIVGTTTVITGMPPNGRHRGEIAKVLVLPSSRRRGIARALMLAAEALARQAGKRTLVLDTAGAAADQLYRALGWQVAGVIPNYAADIHGKTEATTYMFKELADA